MWSCSAAARAPKQQGQAKNGGSSSRPAHRNEEEHVPLGLGGHGGPSDAQEHGSAQQHGGRGAAAARGEQEPLSLRRSALPDPGRDTAFRGLANCFLENRLSISISEKSWRLR